MSKGRGPRVDGGRQRDRGKERGTETRRTRKCMNERSAEYVGNDKTRESGEYEERV